MSIESHRMSLVSKQSKTGLALVIQVLIQEELMITGAMIVSKSGDAKPGKRVDLICKYYPCFLVVVENYIVKMKKDIIDEQDFNRRDRMGDLGIRVQTSNIGDPTQSLAVRRTMLEEAIRSGNFNEGELDDTDNKEEYIYKSSVIRDMLYDYKVFQDNLNGLMPAEKELFISYLEQKVSLLEIAESLGIKYDSAGQKIRRIKLSIKCNMAA